MIATIKEVSKEELLVAHHTLFENFTKLYDAHKLLKKDHENLKKTSSNIEDLESLRKGKRYSSFSKLKSE